jgi:hypothetical protein
VGGCGGCSTSAVEFDGRCGDRVNCTEE